MADFYKNIDKICAERIGERRDSSVSGVEYTFLTDISEEPVSLEFFKEHCRVDYNTDDALLSSYLKAARQHLERVAQLSFGEREVQMTALSMVDNWKVMYGPVHEVLSGHTKFGRDIITDSGGKMVSIKWRTKWTTELPEDIKIAICRYGAGLYAMRENLILSVNGVVHEVKGFMDEAEKMVMRYGNITFI